MAAVAILKNHTNRDITPTDWPIFAKFGMIMQIGPLRGETVKISKFWKSKMAEQKNNLQPKVKRKYCYIKWSVLHVHMFERKKIKKQI